MSMLFVETRLKDLRTIHVFSGLSEAAVRDLAGACIRRSFAGGAAIIDEGDACTAAYFILQGEVAVYRLAVDGRAQILARLGAGQAFNTVPPLSPQGLNHGSARAIGDVVLLALPKDDYNRLLQKHSDMAYALLLEFARRMAHLTDLVEDLSLHSVRGRLARFLLEHAGRGGPAQRWTQDEIAERLGTVRDVVGRTLRAFIEGGLVRRERQRFVLLDRAGLEEEAKA